MTASANAIQSAASKLATLVKDGSPLDKLVVDEIGHREELKVSAVKVWLAMTADEALMAKLEAGELPEPDSGPEGNNPDLYSESKGNGKAKRVGSFWGDFALSLPTARKWVTYKRTLDEAFAKGDKARDPQYQQYWSKGESWGKAEKSMYSQRLSATQNLIRNAVRIGFKMNEINDTFDGITVSFDMDEKTGQVKRVKAPILIWTTPVNVEGQAPKAPVTHYLSQGQFLALDLDKAREHGGTIDALVSSGNRSANPPSTIPDIQSVRTFLDTMVGVYSFFDSANNVTKLVNELVKDENLNEVKYVAEVYLKLDAILKGFPKIRKAFDKVTGQTSDDEAEAA